MFFSRPKPLVSGTICIFVAILLCIRQIWRYRRLPPGPPAGFLGLGDHTSLIRKVDGLLWTRYQLWAKQYGSIFSYRLGGNIVVVLSSAKVAWDLLEKRGEIYSSRPRQIMAQELASGSLRGGSAPYGSYWRRWRKIQHQGMSYGHSETYKPFQVLESCVLLQDLLRNSNQFTSHIQRFSTSIVFAVSYGIRIKSLNDPAVKENQQAVESFIRYLMPGAYLVESYPILLWLPRKLQWFRTEPERLKILAEDAYMRLLNDVDERVQKGSAKESLSSRLLASGNDHGFNKVEMAWAVSAPFAAGVETTRSSIRVFILAMLHYPEVAQKAQAELDTMVGRTRMPTFDDQDSLPYIRALIKEVTRWKTISPLGLPHAVTEDDFYEGFYIPKGATVHAHIYDMTRDADLFPDPDIFRPERFLETSNPRLIDFTLPFGFGRRICPGMHVAGQSLFIVISRLLWSFDILPKVDTIGHPNLPSVNAFQGEFTLEPAPFECQFVIRRPEIVNLIEQEALEANKELTAWS